MTSKREQVLDAVRALIAAALLDADVKRNLTKADRIPPGGRLRVYRSDDRAESWQECGKGLPDSPVYAGVLRGALDATDGGLVAFGTTSGDLWASADAGESWEALDVRLPRVFAVAVGEG